MKDSLHSYRVCYRKKGDNKDVVLCIGIDDPGRLEKIVMDMAGVRSMDELDQFESHLIRQDGTTEVKEHVKQRPTPVQLSPLPAGDDLLQEKKGRSLPEPLALLTHFFKTAIAEVKTYA